MTMPLSFAIWAALAGGTLTGGVVAIGESDQTRAACTGLRSKTLIARPERVAQRRLRAGHLRLVLRRAIGGRLSDPL